MRLTALRAAGASGQHSSPAAKFSLRLRSPCRPRRPAATCDRGGLCRGILRHCRSRSSICSSRKRASWRAHGGNGNRAPPRVSASSSCTGKLAVTATARPRQRVHDHASGAARERHGATDTAARGWTHGGTNAASFSRDNPDARKAQILLDWAGTRPRSPYGAVARRPSMAFRPRRLHHVGLPDRRIRAGSLSRATRLREACSLRLRLRTPEGDNDGPRSRCRSPSDEAGTSPRSIAALRRRQTEGS